MPTVKIYTLSRRSKTIVVMELIVFYCVFPISIFGILGSLFFILDSIFFSRQFNDEMLGTLFVSLACFFLSSVMLPSMINEYNEIRAYPEGLSIKVFQFIFRWIFVNWEDIIDIHLINTPIFEDSVWAIVVRKLTVWHGMIGRRFGMSPYSIIIIQSDLDGVEDLLNVIESHKKSA